MKGRLYGFAVVLILFAGAPTDCNLADVTSGLQVMNDLSTSKDPGEQAASKAGDTAAKQQQADDLVKQSVVNGKTDVSKIDQAEKILPSNTYLRLDKAAIQVADGQDPTDAIGEAKFLISTRTKIGPESDDLVLEARYLRVLGSYASTFPDGSVQRQRLMDAWCVNVRELYKVGGDGSYIVPFKGLPTEPKTFCKA